MDRKISRTSLNLVGSLRTLAFAAGAAALAPGAAGAPGPAAPPAPVVVAATGGVVRVEAIDPHIVRIWIRPSSDFERDRSLAMLEAPAARIGLQVSENGGQEDISTGELRVRVARQPLQLDVSAADGTPLVSAGRPRMSGAGPAWSFACAVGSDERLLGLGQDNESGGRLDRRGTVRDLWAGQKIKSGNVTAQYPIPLLLSTGRGGHAYGVFYDNVHRLRFDLAKTRPDEVRCDADGGELDLYVLDGPRLADVIERYTALTGRPPLPPLWALGYWQSKCTYRDWDEIDEAYRQLTVRGFPVDVMVIDADWPEHMTDYTWAKRWYAQGVTPAAKIAWYARHGVHIVMSQSGPMVRRDSPNFESGWKAGLFATDGDGHTLQCGWYDGQLLDYTHPGLDQWLWPQTRPLVEQGISGWWLDLVEPELEPPQTRYFAGRPAEIHNEFSLLCARTFEGVQLAVHPDQRPFILARCGAAGFQRFHAAVWTGDVTSDYPTLRAHPPEMLNAGLSGLVWWTCDTGGFLTGYYKNDRFGAHAALYDRWMEFSAFSPIVRAHKAGGLPEPYQFGAAVEESTRRYLKLRYRLLPYIYSYAWEASRLGLPLVRPLALEFPDDPRSVAAPGDEYLFGRELLVAPVLSEGLTSRSVYFPPGLWFDWDTGREYAGGRDWVVDAPPGRIPVAVRAGAIIPMAPDMYNTQSGTWDPLTLEIFPSGRSSFTLYRDDGTTFAYRGGDFTVTNLSVVQGRDGIRLTVDESNKRYAPARYRIRFHLDGKPGAVRADGNPVEGASGGDPLPGQSSWDAAARVLTVVLDDEGAVRHTVDVLPSPGVR